jgi:hypothetical protein
MIGTYDWHGLAARARSTRLYTLSKAPKEKAVSALALFLLPVGLFYPLHFGIDNVKSISNGMMTRQKRASRMSMGRRSSFERTAV